MRQAIAKHAVIGLLLAAPLGTAPALAEQRSANRTSPFFGFGIQCAGASDLCAWKRIPGAGGFEGFEARPARPRSNLRRSPRKPDQAPH